MSILTQEEIGSACYVNESEFDTELAKIANKSFVGKNEQVGCELNFKGSVKCHFITYDHVKKITHRLKNGILTKLLYIHNELVGVLVYENNILVSAMSTGIKIAA